MGFIKGLKIGLILDGSHIRACLPCKLQQFIYLMLESCFGELEDLTLWINLLKLLSSNYRVAGEMMVGHNAQVLHRN